MKKGILFIYSTIVLGCFSAQETKAQDFDLEFNQYFTAHVADYPGATDAKTAITKWRGANTAGVPALLVTMNNISANVFQNSRVNNITFNPEAGTTNPAQTFLRAQLGHNDAIIVLRSANALRKIALQYASGTMMITYYPAVRPDTAGLGPLAVPTMDDWKSTGLNKILATHDGTIPGPAEYVDVNDNANGGTVYAEMQRAFTLTPAFTYAGSPKLYRIAASKTDFTTLPLNFLSFTAKADAFGKTVSLNWQTANEMNTKNFIIEKRTDGTAFAPIGNVPSKNVAGVNSYTFVDNNATSGNAYYRLTQVDNDEKSSTYEVIRHVSISGQVSLSLYPNPATDEVNLTHAAASNASVKIVNIQGKTVAEQALSNGSTSSSVNVSQLVTGTYVLVLDNGGKQSTIKFVKQ